MTQDKDPKFDSIDGINIPGMTDKINYDVAKKMPVLGQDVPEKVKKEMDETRKKLDEFKKKVLKKYPFTLGIGIIPPQAAARFDEEMALTEEEKKTKPMHVVIVIPESHFKEIGKIKTGLLEDVKDINPPLWLTIITPVDLANFCLDSKFDIIEAIGMSYPLHDSGRVLEAFRISQIHKSLCLRKFEKYIYSYVVFGSHIRGEGSKTSDVDVFVIIDDTDVKRIPRLELKEKLRGIIQQYIAEATELSGSKIPLHVQVYLLTEFWEDVKDASPVIFSAIRDGVPLYDRGGFLPWKLLLKMGKITPSPEAIDRFMSMGDKNKEIVNRRLIDAMIDMYYSVLSPSQALLMLYGLPPTTIQETVKEMRRIFVDEEKILEKKYTDILEKLCIKYWKGYEHGKIKEISGKEIDQLLKETEDYMKRLKELRKDIEKKAQERTLKQTHDNVFKLLTNLFGKKTEPQLIRLFEKEIVSKGRADPGSLRIMKEIAELGKKSNAKKKPTKYEVENIRKNAAQLINNLIEYGQRCELSEIKKMQVMLHYGRDRKKKAELFLTNPGFVFIESKMYKIDEKQKKVIDFKQEEFESVMSQQKGKPSKLTKAKMDILKKELGGFDIIF